MIKRSAAPAPQNHSTKQPKSANPQSRSRRKKKGIPLIVYFTALPLIGLLFVGRDLLSNRSRRHKNKPKQELPTLQLIESPNTVVTAYFPVKSKYAKEKYKGWMGTMLGLQDPMVIFSSPDMVETIVELRSHALNRTLVIPMELVHLPLVRQYPLEIWEAEYDKDPEKRRHAGYEVFWIWLSKTWFLDEAVRRNPFSSAYFMWSDIGCFRSQDERWKGQTMMQHTDVIPPGRMLFMAHHNPNPPPTSWWTNKLREPQHFYHSGTMMAGSKETIQKFHQVFLQTIQGFLDRKLFIGDDQTVLQCTCLQHPDLCAYAVHNEVPDNYYFGLRTVLQKGGKYDFWIPPSPTREDTQSAKYERPTNILESPHISLKPEVSEEYDPSKRISIGSLPSAKTLLTKPPPFDDSQIIRLSDQLIAAPNTVVTAYYRVPSKFKAESYNEWMKNMLSLQDAMVIFTSRDLISVIQELRSHAKNRTVIVPLELNDLPVGTLYSKEFWQDQLDRDPEIKRHKSYELFWIWLSKSWWTMQAIRMNIFQSDIFMWSDIGCFRNNLYNFKEMIRHRELIPRHEMIQMAHHWPNPPSTGFFNDKYGHRENFYHSGSQMAAYADTWKVFHEYFLDTIDGFLERNMIIVEDQVILQSVCLRHPEICAYVPYNQVRPYDNHYFGLRYVLNKGGEFKLWRLSKALQ